MSGRIERIDDPRRMHALAEEYRAIAENTKDPTCRRQLFGIARTYDKIADDAEVRGPPAGSSH